MIVISTRNDIQAAAKLIKKSKRVFAFTGAGISVESGIPSFRGENGLWKKYDPIFLDINYFKENPEQSWKLNYQVFYKFFNKSKPNLAHQILAKMEECNLIQGIITQNIDSLHHQAGSKNIYEFHGNSRNLVCIDCKSKVEFQKKLLDNIPPFCNRCGGILKPDYIFFGEPIPEPARTMSFNEAELCDLLIIIGTTGEVQPAAQIPYIAKRSGSKILEINIKPSLYTEEITDLYLEGKATEKMNILYDYLK